MTTLTSSPQETRLAAPPVRGGPLIVASSGREDTFALCGTAEQIAHRLQVPVRIVTAVDAALDAAPATDFGVVVLGMPAARQAAREAELRERLRQLFGARTAWPVDIMMGTPAQVVADAARLYAAQMVVMGRGKHRLLGRLLGGETALRTVRAARCAVLTVSTEWNALPSRIVVAVDFSAASVAAAQRAIHLAARDATIFLVHVWSRGESSDPGVVERDSAFERDLPGLFARFRDALSVPPGVMVRPTWLIGHPVEEIITFAEERDAQLVASGTRGAGFLERLIVGSVASGLLRAARCAVLTVPAPMSTEDEHLERRAGGRFMSLDRTEWSAPLEAFSARNRGRRTVLEVDDPAIGAQVQQRGYVLMGATWDHRAERIELMFGGAANSPHFTRSIANATQIAILAADWRRDEVLRIVHEGGQTLLTFLR